MAFSGLSFHPISHHYCYCCSLLASWLANDGLVPTVNINFPNGSHTQLPACLCGYIFSCDQAAIWMVQSVRPSVRLSVRPSVRPSVCLSHLFDYVPIILSSWNFQELLPVTSKSDVHAKGQGQRSKVKVTEVTIQLNRFRTVTPVWIHIWWDDAYSLIMLRRGALLFFKVIRQISRSHGSKNRRIRPRLGVSGL